MEKNHMKTFTLEELKYDGKLIRTLNIVKLPSGAFTLESFQHHTSDNFNTKAEGNKAVARCDEEFATEEAAGAALDAAIKFYHEGFFKELENKNTLMTVVETIPVEGGKVIRRTGRFTQDWYTLYDAHGNEQGSANSTGLLSMTVTSTV